PAERPPVDISPLTSPRPLPPLSSQSPPHHSLRLLSSPPAPPGEIATPACAPARQCVPDHAVTLPRAEARGSSRQGHRAECGELQSCIHIRSPGNAATQTSSPARTNSPAQRQTASSRGCGVGLPLSPDVSCRSAWRSRPPESLTSRLSSDLRLVPGRLALRRPRKAVLNFRQ